jgi:hypothetical protein
VEAKQSKRDRYEGKGEIFGKKEKEGSPRLISMPHSNETGAGVNGRIVE